MAEPDPRERWLRDAREAPCRQQPPTTVSGVEVEPLYTSRQLDDSTGELDLGYPGQYPFVRGVYPTDVGVEADPPE